jgi:hypothetical protein
MGQGLAAGEIRNLQAEAGGPDGSLNAKLPNCNCRLWENCADVAYLNAIRGDGAGVASPQAGATPKAREQPLPISARLLQKV